MIEKIERRTSKYRLRMKAISTFAFIKARYGHGSVTHEEICEKYSGIDRNDIVSYMNESFIHEMFERVITERGMKYILRAKFADATIDEACKYVCEQLKKR